LNNLSPLGTLTFISSVTPWIEPQVSFAQSLNQTIVLTGPVRLDRPNFGIGAQINGPQRVAITNSLTVSNLFTFSAPVQLYVSTAQGQFQFNLTLNGSITFSTTPSLFNPLGFNLVSATNFIVDSDNTNNVIKFNLNTPLTIGNLNINLGIVQFTSNSVAVTANIVNVAGRAFLWVDGSALTTQQLIFNQAPNGDNPSNFIFTISSASPTPVQTGVAVYKGVAQVNVFNFAWSGNAITAISATSANSDSANFQYVTGNPGFNYVSTRSGNNIQFSRTSNPSVSPFPTQSNGPSPGVSGSSIISINMIIFSLIMIFFIFN